MRAPAYSHSLVTIHYFLGGDERRQSQEAVEALAHEQDPRDLASLPLLEGLGPRTLQSLALIAEVVHDAPARFSDPARFSFAHGGKDGHPFPFPLKTCDDSTGVLRRALDQKEKIEGFGHLDRLTRAVEQEREPLADFAAVIAEEHRISPSFGGRTVLDHKPARRRKLIRCQLSPF